MPEDKEKQKEWMKIGNPDYSPEKEDFVIDNQKIDYSKDMFGKPAFLSVSGQLNAESLASGLSDVYSFGPTFRAENSNSPHHLCEFWMVEPEMAFADNNDNMDCAEKYLKYTTQYVLQNNRKDLEFFQKRPGGDK